MAIWSVFYYCIDIYQTNEKLDLSLVSIEYINFLVNLKY